MTMSYWGMKLAGVLSPAPPIGVITLELNPSLDSRSLGKRDRFFLWTPLTIFSKSFFSLLLSPLDPNLTPYFVSIFSIPIRPYDWIFYYSTIIILPLSSSFPVDIIDFCEALAFWGLSPIIYPLLLLYLCSSRYLSSNWTWKGSGILFKGRAGGSLCESWCLMGDIFDGD